jgi:FkbM family methyltransferase
MIKNIISKYIKTESPFILDIGSYDGRDSLDFLEIYPEAKITAFEADPRSVEVFRKLTPDIPLIEAAVCDIDGEVDWFSSFKNIENPRQSSSSSINKPKNHLKRYERVSFEQDRRVKAIRLDSWYNTSGLSTIDLIWADVNGGERELITGAQKALENTRLIYLEYSDLELYEGQATLDEIQRLLPSFRALQIFREEGFSNILMENSK